MGEKSSTYICENCDTKIIYYPDEETESSDFFPVLSCPVCGAVVQALGRAKVVAFFRKPKSKRV